MGISYKKNYLVIIIQLFNLLVFTFLPFFTFLFFKASNSDSKTIINIERNFIWGWVTNNRTITWISWENCVCQRKKGAWESRT